MTATNGTSNKPPDNSGKLNVILHGVFTYAKDDAKNQIIAYIPNMGSEHLYKAGNWLAETTLAQGADLRLVGVKEEDRQNIEYFDSEKNIVLKDVRVDNAGCCDRVYATLHLPRPAAPIQSLGVLTIRGKDIGGDSAGRIEGFDPSAELHSATVQVLTYEFDSDSDLRLGDHPWEPVLDNGYVNLHVYCEPERPPEQDHVRHAFQMSASLFTGVDLSLRRPARAGVQAPTTPAGIHELELQDLVRRQRWLAMLGRAIRENRDINGIWDDPTALDGSDALTCSGGDCGS